MLGPYQRYGAIPRDTNAWSLVRVPLITAVALLLASLGVNQADLSAAGLALPGVLGLLPGLWRRLSGAA